jgi:hypothetical protein
LEQLAEISAPGRVQFRRPQLGGSARYAKAEAAHLAKRQQGRAVIKALI